MKDVSNLEKERVQHESFIKLMGYLNEYKNSISYDTSGLINIRKKTDPDDFEALENQKKFSAANMFPIEKSGPNKGKYVPKRDERGNIIVDPTQQI